MEIIKPYLGTGEVAWFSFGAILWTVYLANKIINYSVKKEWFTDSFILTWRWFLAIVLILPFFAGFYEQIGSLASVNLAAAIGEIIGSIFGVVIVSLILTYIFRFLMDQIKKL